MSEHDVIIVGGGLAGLTAALVLHAAGARVQLLEADQRLGGRIHALVDQVTGCAIADLGPTWVWPTYQPAVARWLAQLQLATFEQWNAGDGLVDGWGPDVQRYPIPSQEDIARIVGGPVALIATLAKRIPPVSLRTGASVRAVVERDASTMGVTLHSGETLMAPRVIVAAPLRIVSASIAMPDLDPAVVRDMQHVPTWMSTQAKAVALYDRPFWRDDGLSGRIASRVGPLSEAHDHTPADDSVGAIFGFVQWTPAERRDEPDALRRAVLAQLVRCLGAQAALPRDLQIEDWALNRWVCSAADLGAPSQHPEPASPLLRAAHVDGKLRFAVSETSAVSPGLIEGALIAGERAAIESSR